MIEEIKAVIEKHKEFIPVIVIAELLTILDEEEYCEWTSLGKYDWLFFSPHKVKDARYKEDICDRPYCQVCGKRIKAVVNDLD